MWRTSSLLLKFQLLIYNDAILQIQAQHYLKSDIYAYRIKALQNSLAQKICFCFERANLDNKDIKTKGYLID